MWMGRRKDSDLEINQPARSSDLTPWDFFMEIH